MIAVSTIGLDIAKNVFQAHRADEAGNVVFRKQLRRHKLLEFFASCTPCLVAMEACSGAHYWAREIGKFGHHVRQRTALGWDTFNSAGCSMISKRSYSGM